MRAGGYSNQPQLQVDDDNKLLQQPPHTHPTLSLSFYSLLMSLATNTIPKVDDVVPTPVPAQPPLLVRSLTKHARLHPVVVQGVVLHEVDEVELVGDPSAHVGDCKVKPLGVALGVDIWLEDEVWWGWGG